MLDRSEDHAVITVRDTGTGIAPEILPHIFARGFTSRPTGGGDGLGLFLVQSIVLEHGGSIQASSPPEGGSVFTLRFPLLSRPLP